MSKRKNKFLTEYQTEVRKVLVDIGGVPHESISMGSLGLACRVWTWNIGEKSKRKGNVLVMADKAQDLGLQVYRIKRYVKELKHFSQETRYDVVFEMEEVNRVAVWCPEEPI